MIIMHIQYKKYKYSLYLGPCESLRSNSIRESNVASIRKK